MNQEYTPKYNLQYINETILNTPQPQASSTVERKGVISNRFYSGKSEANKFKNDNKKKTKELLDHVPTRDTDTMSVKSNSSRLSSSSSLGILSLENMEEFPDYLNNVTKNTSLANDMKSCEVNINVNEKLQMQRILAQKALERADAKTYTGGLPSHLLKPSDTPGKNNMTSNTMPRNESTINLSDLEKSLPRTSGIKTSDMSGKLSFEAKEISARSSSFGTKYNRNSAADVIDLTGQSPIRDMSFANDFSSKCQSIYGKIRQSDISIAEMCDRSSKMGIHTQPLGTLPLPDIETINISSGSESSWCNGPQDSLMANLKNELFTPAELAGDKLLEDEISWRKEKDIIPVDSYSTAKKATSENAHTEMSCFSGYIDDEDISLNKDGKTSFGEYFKRRTEDVDKLDLKASPEKQYAPIPLINLTSSTCKFDESVDVSVPRTKYPLREETQVILSPSADFSRMSTDSIMSVTRIAEVIAQMAVDETPSRIMDVLLKKTAGKSTSLRKVESNVSENPSVTTISSSSTLKLSKLTDSSKTITQQSSVDISSKENSKFTSKSPQIKKSTESVLKDTTNILEKHAFEQENVLNDVNKNVTSDGDWTDAKPHGNYTPEHNRTLSSITESPSYSCSELEFSEDDNPHSADNTLHKHTEIWLEIEHESQPRKLYTYIPHKTAITVNSLTSHWLLVKVHVKDISNLTNIARIELFNEEGLLKSQAKEQLEFKITSFITGKIELVFQIEMTDMATKARKQTEHRLVFESEKPQIQLSKDKLDYSTNCEGCIKKMNVTVCNNGSADLPLTFVISQKYEWIYLFTTEMDRDKSDDTDSEVITMKSSVLAAGGSITLFIDMHCPQLADLNCSTNQIELQGLLHVYTSEPFKLLKEIDLVGRVGLTKIQFKCSSMPVVLLSGQTKGISVRNSGKVIMELATKIVDETRSPINTTYFTVEEPSIVLKPGQVGNVHVTFNCRDKVVGSIKRILRLEYHRGPGFAFPIEGITEDKDSKATLAVTKSPLLGKSPRASPVASRLSKGRRSVEVKSVSPSASDRANTRNSQTGRSSTNSSDSGTLSYLQGGKLPIESTRTELIWGCVKPGKTTSQEFILRNRCSQRLRLQATINGTGFKLIKDQTESVTTLSLMLHSLESRTITVNFSPNSKGAAAAKLIFLPIENDVIHSKRQMVTNKKQVISLYAYGGYCNVDIQKVAKDTSGKMWLSFGRLDYRGNLQQSLILRNTGSLAAFACLTVGCKVLYPFMDSSVKITPTEVVILPNKEVEVCVSFTPRQEDFKYIQTSNGIAVSEIASINVLSGPEPTRGRIRRLFNKMSHQGILPQMSNEFLIPKLSATFIQEHMPLDLLNCKESPGAMKELLQDLITREISLTIEHDPEKSGLASVLGADDTCMFHSLCNETAQTTLDASYGQFETQPSRRASGGFCTVEPTKLMLTPPMKTEDTVLVSSRHSRPMPFEISIPNGGLQVSPSVGVVPPGETTVLTISCSKTQPKPLQFFKVMIYVENEVMEIEVKIHFVQARRS